MSENQAKRIFALTGLPGVGKSAVASELADFDGFPIVNMGDEMRQQYSSLPTVYRNAPENTWEMAQALRETHGGEGTALASVTRIAASFVVSPVVLVDGVRSVEEVQTFTDVFDVPVHLISVHADDETRLERFVQREGYYDAFEEWDEGEEVAEAIGEYELTRRTARENSVGLDDALEYANYSISNNGDIHDAGQQCARLLDDFYPLI